LLRGDAATVGVDSAHRLHGGGDGCGGNSVGGVGEEDKLLGVALHLVTGDDEAKVV
jgi:hypothetical protein